jgi:hypothetical protein
MLFYVIVCYNKGKGGDIYESAYYKIKKFGVFLYC